MEKYIEVLRLIDEGIKQKGWNRTDLIKALNKTDAWISKVMVKFDIKMGKKRKAKEVILSVPMLLEIAEALNIDPKSLVPGTSQISFDEYLEEKLDKKIEEKMKGYKK